MAEPHRASADVTHTTLSVLFLALLIAASFWVLSPFLTAILWATIVGVATWPVVIRLEKWLGGRRGLAVTAMTAAILLVVFVPVMLALNTIVHNAQNISTEIKSLESITLPPPPAGFERVPVVGRRITDAWTRFSALGPAERAAEVTPYVQSALRWFASKAGSVGATLLQFLLTTIISAIVLSNGEAMRDGILRFARRLAGQQGFDAAMLAARTIRAVVLGVVGTALLQSAIGGAGLLLCGVPAAGLLTAVMLFLCLAQIGPLLVLVPAVVWLYWSGHPILGTTLVPIALLAGTLDNVLRPIIIKRGANVPLVLIFAGVLGGLLALGVVGLFIGPVVLTVASTLLANWVAAGESQPATVPG